VSESAVLEARQISKYFPGVVANEDVNLSLNPGEIVALLGENGAGKSTLMNIIYGLYQPSSGEIRVKGRSVKMHSPRDAIDLGIGMVHQHFQLVPVMTVVENVMLGSESVRQGLLDREKVSKRIQQLSQDYQLEVDPNALVEDLPVGIRQRVEIIKALYREADILILDEPTAGVDVALRQRLWDNIKTLNRAGVTVVLTTHYLEEAEALCDQIAIVNKGRIITAKSKADLMASAGKKHLHLTLDSPPPAPLPKTLQQLGAVWRDGRLSISFDPTKTTTLALLAEVQKANFEVRDISTAEPDLEDVFISLTQ